MTEPQDKSQSRASADLDAKLQAEIEAALGDMSIDDMLDVADHPRPSPIKGQMELKTGTIAGIHGSGSPTRLR